MTGRTAERGRRLRAGPQPAVRRCWRCRCFPSWFTATTESVFEDCLQVKRLQRAGGPKNESPSTSPYEQDGACLGFCGRTTRCVVARPLVGQASRAALSSLAGRRGESETSRALRSKPHALRRTCATLRFVLPAQRAAVIDKSVRREVGVVSGGQ